MTKYSYATTTDLYLLDESCKILKSQKLTEDEATDIANGLLTHKEKELLSGDKVILCNAKKDHNSISDYDLLHRIVTACNTKTVQRSLLVEITKKKITASVSWDTLLCQAIRSIDEVDKAINLLSKRLREWYEWHNPEFSKSIDSHEKFALLITEKTRDELLKEIHVTKSMGLDFEQSDLDAVLLLAREISTLVKLRENITEYIQKNMKEHLPNFTLIAGSQVGAKLLALSGNVTHLMKMTASTIQVLGAEKALFRHLKTGARPPKYGVLYQHQFVSKAKPMEKGRVARMLANSLAIAIKADYFKTGSGIGKQLLAKIEEKL